MKTLLSGVLLLLFAGMASMLPLRYGMKGVSRSMMHDRIAAAEDSAGAVFVESAAIPDDAWEDSKEFRWRGRLYDVAGVSYRGGVKYYRCLADDVELSAEATADNIVGDMASPDPATPRSKLHSGFIDWLSQLYHDTLSWQQIPPPPEPDAAAISAPIACHIAPVRSPGRRPPRC